MMEVERYRRALHGEPLEWLQRRGLKPDTIKRAMLGYVPDGRYAGSISIPYFLPSGVVRGLRYRYLNPDERGKKYDNPKGMSVHLYNVARVDSPHVWICEGEFDTLILDQEGFPAVGIPGAKSFKGFWRYLFVHCEQVSIVCDADEAGRSGAARIASLLGQVVSGDIRIVHLPEGMDVTDLYLHDRDSLRELMS
jgi:DNA primase